MIGQTRAELLKISSTRTTLGLLLGLLGLVLLFVVLTGSLDSSSALAQSGDQRNMLGIGQIASIFAGIAGVLVIASEYRFGTIRPTFVLTPQRSRVVGAKLGAAILAGFAFGLAAEALAFGLGRIFLAGRGLDLALDGHELWLLVAGSILGTALWAGIGVGIGAILRNHVAAVITLLVWIFVVDNRLFGLVPRVGRFMPSAAMSALVGDTDSDLVAPAAGAVILIAWVSVLALAGLALLARRDVS